MKKYQYFLSENFPFFGCKISMFLNSCVFVMFGSIIKFICPRLILSQAYYTKYINPGPAELGYALPFANNVDPYQLTSSEAN